MAIIAAGGKCAIDPAKCANCGICIGACPFGAIANNPTPPPAALQQ
jgi:ferredoxin